MTTGEFTVRSRKLLKLILGEVCEVRFTEFELWELVNVKCLEYILKSYCLCWFSRSPQRYYYTN
jgi:hypothetical protein